MSLRKGWRYDRKTGRPRRVDPRRSRMMRMVARRRRGRRVRPSTILKRKRSLALTRRRGRTKAGRAAKFHHKH